MPIIKNCIFDFDGLLVDSEPIYSIATSLLLNTYGKALTDDLKRKLLGLSSQDSAKMIINETSINANVEDLKTERSKIIIKLFQEINLKLMPGALEIVTHLNNHGIPIAIATSSSRSLYDLKIKDNKEFFKMFGENITFGDDLDVGSGKPSPDIFLSAWKKLGCPLLENCLVFEDALNGVKAAISAGMNVLWVSSINNEMEVFNNVKKISSLDLFIPEDYMLPAYD